MRRWATKSSKGFTIVELLIVIVVIAILAAITVVAYNGIRERAERSSVDAAMNQASKQIAAFHVGNNETYPISISDCPTPATTNLCIKPGNVTYRYKSVTTAAAAGYAGALQQPAYEISVEGAKYFTYKSTTEITGVNEFVQYMDMAPLIDKYGLVPYEISLEIKSPVAGNVNMYMQNGSGTKYIFSANLPVTANYSRHVVQLTPTLADASQTNSILAFYGTYSTGRISTVKNVQIRLAQ